VKRLYFQIKDGENFVRDDLLTSVKLLNPSNKRLALSGMSFTTNDLGMWAGYNASTGQWIYDGVVHDESGYFCSIDAKRLPTGPYRLVVIYNGIKIEKTDYNFNGLVRLPVIAGSTIKPKLDSKGNLFCTWKIPNSAFYLTDNNPQLAISTRAVIDVYEGSTYKAYIQTTVPIHMGQVFFPADIIDKLKTLGGDTYRFRVQNRSNDNNNRTYSDYVDLNL
jgi:hypothetical protein